MNETTQQPTTRRDLATRGMEALDPAKAGATVVSQTAGGVTFSSAMEVMEFAKLMAVAETGVPEFLRNHPGTCMRIVFQAIEWRMSPFAVADKAYEVKGRMGYESQLIHAVIEARAPLQKRLDCEYDGEGVTRTCTVIGHFTDGETRTYTTPEFQKITVKNSPLWASDPDQQLFYYASRSWARKWCPDVLMGIYSREELRENPELGARDDDAAGSGGLRERLANAPRADNEGARPGHVERELAAVVPDGVKTIELAANPPSGENKAAGAPAQPDKPAAEKSGTKDAKRTPRTGKARKPVAQASGAEPDRTTTLTNPADAPPANTVKQAADRAEKAPEKPAMPKLPKNAAEYAEYCKKWLAESKDPAAINQRWDDERQLRNNCGVTFDDRQPLQDAKTERIEQLQ